LLSTVFGSHFNQEAKDHLIFLHNRARGDVVPPALTPIPDVHWSNAAANHASQWADRCIVEHSQGSGFGENIYYTYGYPGQITAIDGAMGFFEGEEAGFGFNADGSSYCVDQPTCGHYTQVVWADTTGVGCGYAECGQGYTFVVCNYEPAGNYWGREPYVPCLSGDCGGAGPPPPSPSVTPSRTPTRTPTPTGTSSNSASPNPSVPPQASQSPTRTPTPTSSVACNCVANSICVNGECICASGFIFENGACVAPTPGAPASYPEDFEVVGGATDVLAIPDDTLVIQGNGKNVIKWIRSANIIDKYNTKHHFDLKMTSGDFGIAYRLGQGSNRESDRVEFRFTSMNGNNANIHFCVVQNGNDNCWNWGSTYFPTENTLRLKTSLGFDDISKSIMITISWSKNGYSYAYSGYVTENMAPNLGAVGYYFNVPSSAPRPLLREFVLATWTTLTVEFTTCIDDATWADMFYELTGADRATTSVQVRGNGENGNCKDIAANGKAVVSGLTFSVGSLGVPSASLASTFISSVGSPTASGFGITSASVIGGTQGAALAGAPAGISALPGSVGTVGATGGAAGGAGGGAAGGLSGGAIAGIVVGSVAGAVLLVGVATVVVAAVVVGAVVLTRDRDGDDASGAQETKRKSVRQTIRGFFGGVDVMNDPKGHQSISARSPAMK